MSMRAECWLGFGCVVALTVAACRSSSSTTAPADGTLRVAVRVLGGDVDADGFTIVVDGQPQPNVASNSTADVRGVRPGTHVVALSGIADHCALVGAQQHTVTVGAGSVARVMFEVSCLPTGIGVTARTTGVDGPAFYRVAVNNTSMSIVPSDGALLAIGTYAGRYEVSLIVPNENCSVDGGSTRVTDVMPGHLTSVEFVVSCSKQTRVPRIAFALDTTAWGVSARWIGVINVDGSRSHLIERGDHPAWSHDGKMLVVSDAGCDEEDYWFYSCSGGGVLIDPDRFIEKRLRGFIALQADWSPNGSSIAAALCCTDFGTHIGIVNTDGDQERYLTGSHWARAEEPTWSPDGVAIAFACADWPQSYDICTIAPDGSRLTRITSGLGDETNPAWSPNGRRIAFTLNGTEVAIVTVADRAIARLTMGSDPSWSPDGTRLVFVGDNGLFTINADGSNRQRLTTGQYRSPAWGRGVGP